MASQRVPMRASKGPLRRPFVSLETVLSFLVLTVATGLVAHVSLDALANVALAHDPYDDLAHGSRRITFAIVAGLAALAGMRLLYGIVVDAANGRYRERLPAIARIPLPWLVVIVTVASTIVLAALEIADTTFAGERLPDIATIFGGSIALAFATTFACASLTCALARALARALATLRPALVRTVAMLFSAYVSVTAQRPARARRFARSGLRARTVLSRRAGKRAPPLLTTR